jgi:glyoxylase I family protein
MLDQVKDQTETELSTELPLRLHHYAFVVKDQEVNRHFIEDIPGIPLTATWLWTQ